MSSAQIPPAVGTQEVPPALSLSVHLSEYQALTNRITYWISITYVTYSVAAILIPIVVQAWDNDHVSLVLKLWGGSLLILLVVWAWVYSVWEILNTTLYLEGILRRKVEGLLKEKSFWCWESYLAGQRSKGYSRYEWRFSLLIPWIVAIGVSVRFMLIKTETWSDWRPILGAILNIYVLIMIAARVRGINNLQLQIRKIGILNRTSCEIDHTLSALD